MTFCESHVLSSRAMLVLSALAKSKKERMYCRK
jgi:hypothetical protein